MAEADASDLERKARLITAHLDKRKDERVESVRSKKDEDVDRTSKLKTYEYFTKNFKEGCNSLRIKLEEGSLDVNRDRTEVATYLDELSECYESLRKFLNDSTVFLRSFQLEQAQKVLIELEIQILAKRETLQPRKKFAFKSKKKTKDCANDIPTPTPKREAVGDMGILSSQCQVSSKNKETVILSDAEINKFDVSLSKLQHCVVILKGYPGTVHISDIQNSTILCGPVSGSVFVERCASSRIVTGCQQLRIHETTDTDFYLHVTSRAIIEDSKRLRFAPYNWTYEGYDRDLKSSGLRTGINNWDKVDDFNWLSNEPSPNWAILPEQERVGEYAFKSDRST